MRQVYRGKVNRGKLILDRPETYLVRLSELEGTRVELALEKERKSRTLNQNAFYWGVVVEILSNSFGYEPEEMHEALKWKFLRMREDTNLVTVRSTAALNTVEFNDYIDRIMRWASQEYQIYIPDPEGYV